MNARTRRVTRILKRDGSGCFYCSQPMSLKKATIEHLRSRWEGGSNHLHNLVLAHKRCNNSRSQMTMEEKLATK